MVINLNETAPEALQTLLVDFGSVAPTLNKYVPIEALYPSVDDSCRAVLDAMVPYMVSGYRSTLVDYRVMDLQEGQCCCPLDNWHLDVVRNPYHKSKGENHLIYTTTIGTEFIMDKLKCLGDDFTNVIMPEKPTIWQAPPNTICRYGRWNMHRAPRMIEAGRRVLIRVTQTDVI